jgi:hypothetical protein
VAGELGGLDILHNNAGTFYDCVCRRPEILLQGSHCTKLNRRTLLPCRNPVCSACGIIPRRQVRCHHGHLPTRCE